MPATEPLPGPRGLPLLGNLLELKPEIAHQVMEDWAEEHGPLFEFSLGSRRMVGVADADLILELLRNRPETYKRMEPIREVFLEMGIPGVFPVEGEQWQRQRKIWNTAMSLHRVKVFFDQVAMVTLRLKRHWSEISAPVDMVADLMRYTVDVTSLFAFGHDPDTINHEKDVVQEYLQHIFPAVHRRTILPFAYWRLFKLPSDRRLDAALQGVRAFVGERISEARQRLSVDAGLRAAPENLLEALIVASEREGEALSDEEVFGNTIGVLLAGEDTTAYTMSWMIHELIAHPSVRERLRAEVDSVVDEQGMLPNLESVQQVPYLDAVMNETLRLRPVAPFMGFTSLVDTKLGEREFPAGTHFIVSPRSAAKNPAQFKDPLEFRPERWLELGPSESVRRPPTPFGGGRRICPGRSLAQLEVRSVLAMLLHNFDFERSQPEQPVSEHLAFTMGPKGLDVVLSSRH